MNAFLPLLVSLALPQSSEGSRIDAALQRATGGAFWGAVGVARGGDVLLEKGYGFADYGEHPNGPDTLFEIASVSKQFTAAAVLKLRMQDRLELEDTLDEHFADVPADKRAITVHQLLTHTSGLSPEVGLPYASQATREELVATVLGAPLVADPGQEFVYCNAAYALLAALVEVASGESFEDYLERELFSQADLRDTGFIGDEDLDRRRAAVRLGKSESEATAVDWFWGWGYRGMGGVVTTVRDMLAWDRALRGGKVLDEQARALLYAPARGGYACGWHFERTASDTTRVHHSGGVAGFKAFYSRWLEDDVALVILSNDRGDLLAVQAAIEELLFPSPQVEMTLDWGPYSLGEGQAIVFEGGAAWTASRWAGGLELALTDPARDHVLATLRLPEGTARKLAADLAAINRDQGGEESGDPSMETGLYLLRYDAAAGRIDLGRGLSVRVLPEYRGMGADGKPIRDERPTLIVVDEIHGMWPVMTKMNRPAAEALGASLARAFER